MAPATQPATVSPARVDHAAGDVGGRSDDGRHRALRGKDEPLREAIAATSAAGPSSAATTAAPKKLSGGVDSEVQEKLLDIVAAVSTSRAATCGRSSGCSAISASIR